MTKKKTVKRTAKKAASKPRAKKLARGGSIGEQLQAFCRTLPHVVEDVKWGADLMFSVGLPGRVKMFAGFEVDNPDEFAFKCSEETFLGLIQIEGVIPAPYAAKHFWVKVKDPRARSLAQWREHMRTAHEIVASCLPVGVRKEMAEAAPPAKKSR